MDCPQRQAAQQPAPTPGPQTGQGNRTEYIYIFLTWNQVKGIHWFIEVLVVETQHVEWFYIISVAFSVTKIPIWLHTAVCLHRVLHCWLENTRRAFFLHCSKSDNIFILTSAIMMLLFMRRVQWQPPTPPWRTLNLLQSSSPLRAPSLLRGVSRNFPPPLCRDSEQPIRSQESDQNHTSWLQTTQSACSGTWCRPANTSQGTPTVVLPPSCDISCPALAIILLMWARQLQLLANLLDYQNIMTMDGGNEGEKKYKKM